jgi:predicted RNA-binding protein associated with RNAse of E/G family
VTTVRRWSPGDVVVLREIADGRIWSARPAVVVRDAPHVRAFFTPAGITIRLATDDRGNEVRVPAGPWTLRPRPVTQWQTLSFAWPDERYAVLAMWDHDWAFRRWYVNVEDPLRPTALGFDTTELLLDVVIEPDLASWTWKDEDEVARAVELGILSPDGVSRLRDAAEAGRRRVMDRRPPFDRDWRAWRPDPNWPTPELPAGWDSLLV